MLNSKKIKNTISFGFIVYYPTPKFFKRLKLLESLGHKVFLFDNSPDFLKTVKFCQKSRNMFYMTLGRNVGLGIGFSLITAMSYQYNFKTLLYFDQDTGFNLKTINFICSFAFNNYDINKYVGFNFKSSDRCFEFNSTPRDVILSISSGTLFILENLRNIGWHNYSYNIDCVDYELCLRARFSGYKFLQILNTPGFDHESEQPDRVIKLLGKKIMIRRYPANRIYDSFFSYLKLMLYSIKHFDFYIFFLIARSFFIFIIGQLLFFFVKK